MDMEDTNNPAPHLDFIKYVSAYPEEDKEISISFVKGFCLGISLYIGIGLMEYFGFHLTL